MSIFLGLDISTNCTGYTILNSNEDLIDYGFLDTSKEKDWFDKAQKFKFFLEEDIKNKEKDFGIINYIAIEEMLSKFAGGMSSSKTIISLARFNGLASYFCYDVFKIKPMHINVLRARTLADCKVPRGIKSKEFILKKIKKMYPDIVFPKMKNKDKLAKQSYDIADSVVICKALIKETDEIIT